jgi:branched-chain amino acid transport system permease protein
MTTMKKVRPAAIAAALAILLVLPCVVPEYITHVANFVLVMTLPVIGLGFITGFTGRVSLAQGALFGIGAYATALLTTKFGWSPITAFVPSVSAAVIVGVCLGGPAMRLAGLYFVMATVGIQQIVWIVLLNAIGITNGPQGIRSIPVFKLADIDLSMPFPFYYVVLAAATASYFLAKRIIGSRLGLRLRAISDDELAASSIAIRVTGVKLVALALCSAWAGAGGFLYAHYVLYIHPDMFNFELSTILLTMSMFGGYRSLEGMLLATAILQSATEYLRPFGELRMIAYGLLLLLGMMFFPKGVLSLMPRWRKKADQASVEKQEGRDA